MSFSWPPPPPSKAPLVFGVSIINSFLEKWHCACVLWRGYCFPSAPRMQIRDSLPTWLIFVPLFRVHPASVSLASVASVSLAWLTPSLFSVLYGSVQSKHMDCVSGISVHSLVISSFVTPAVLTFMDLSLVSFFDGETCRVIDQHSPPNLWFLRLVPNLGRFLFYSPFFAFQHLLSTCLPKCLRCFNGPH